MQIELPFQVQIQYLAKDGSRYLKVRTKMMPVTVLLDEVEESKIFKLKLNLTFFF